MYRLATMASLLSRQDVIVVASVSSLYGLGQKQFFQDYSLVLEAGKTYDFNLLKRQLIKMQYKPVQSKVEAGMFDFRGELLDIYSSTEKCVYRCRFDEETLEFIEKKDSTTFENIETVKKILLWPATQYLQDVNDIEVILQQMESEMELRVKEFEEAKMFVEAERIKKRVMYDIRMIRET